jgi:hypothetical protein
MALTINLTGVEPAFAKNTAFNKNFGTSSGDILLLGSTSVASKVLVTDSNNKVKTSSTTETQLSYLDATSSIQTQVDNKVPYTGATSDVNLGEFGIQLGNLEFDNTPTNVPTGAGSLYWNDTDGTLDLKLKGGNVTLQVGQEQVTRVVNKTATNITLLEANYQAVRITGAQGQRLKVDLALATTDVLSAETIGLVTETIANNQEGFITTSGLIRGINTTGSLQSETWADGDILYLSGVTAGNITNVKPTAPTHLIVIGYVVHSHITQGTIYVKVDNGYEIGELHNVLLTSSADKDILAYENSTSLWKNKSASTLGIAELASPTFTTDITTPLIIGGTAVGSNITYKSTSGIGTAAGVAHQFIGGTDGGTTLATLYNNGLVNIGNAVITSQRLVRIGQDTARVDIGSLVGVTSQGAIYFSQTTPSASNYALAGSPTVTTLGAPSTVQLTVSNVVKTSISSTQITLTPTTACSFSFGVNICTFSMAAVSGGIATRFVYTAGADTNQIASTELREVHYNLAATKTLNTGALTTQRAFSITAPTYAFTGASTITTAATLSISAAPIAGTNATITNAYALWVQGGKSLFAGNIELTQTVTNEVVVSNRTVTIVINGTTYKLLAVV